MARREEIGINVTAHAEQARREIGSLGGAVRDLGGYSQQAESQHRGLGRAVQGIATGAVMGVGFAAFNQIAGAVGGFGDAVFGMNSMLEKSTLQFEVLFKDADRAKDHVADLFEFAKRTPFETGPIIQASRTLQTFGGDALNTMDNLKMFGDAAAGASVDINEVSFWVGRAYAAIQGGQPFGEARMRLQELALLSPQAAQKMEELQKAGASTAEVWAVMQGELGRFTGSMEKQASTWDGVISTFADTVKLTIASTFEPLFEAIKGGVTGAITFLSSPEVQSAFAAFGAGLGRAINVAITIIGQLVDILGPIIGTVIEVFGVLFPSASEETEEALGRVYEGIEPVTEAASGLIPVIRDVLGIFEPLGAILEAVVTHVNNVVAAFQGLLSGSLSLTEFFDAIIASVTEFIPRLAEGIGQMADNFITWIQDVLPRLGDELPKILSTILNWLVENLPKMVAQLVKWGAALIGWILPRLPGLLAALATFIGKMLIWVVTEGVPKLLVMAAKMAVALIDGLLDIVLGRKGNKGLLANIVDFITKTLIPGILGLLGKLVDAGVKLGAGIGKGFANALIGLIESGINFVIGGINNFIRTVNHLIEALPGDQSMETFKLLSKVHLPRLAQGSLDIPRDMMAIVHKGEMVIPSAIAEGLRGDPGRPFTVAAGLGGGVNINIYQTFGPSSVRSREDIREIGRETAQRARLLGLSVNTRQVGSIAG